MLHFKPDKAILYGDTLMSGPAALDRSGLKVLLIKPFLVSGSTRRVGCSSSSLSGAEPRPPHNIIMN